MEVIANEILGLVAVVATAAFVYVNSKYKMMNGITTFVAVVKILMGVVDKMPVSEMNKEFMAEAVQTLDLIETCLTDMKLTRGELKLIFHAVYDLYVQFTEIVGGDEVVDDILLAEGFE